MKLNKIVLILVMKGEGVSINIVCEFICKKNDNLYIIIPFTVSRGDLTAVKTGSGKVSVRVWILK